MAVSAKPNEIRLIRRYEAPVELVWDAWIDPDKAAKWWGPRGFTLTTHSKDFRVGGNWHYTMHGPDGTDYPNKTIYLEIEDQKRLVYDHGGYDDRPPLFRVTVTFTPCDGGTEMDMTMALATEEAAVATRQFIKQAGGNATWDRLAEYLDQQLRRRDCFVINRSFNAPLELLFEMWTKPELLEQWLPPTGFRMQFLRSDIRPGSSTFFLMTNDAGATLHARCEYQEIQPPDRLVYSQVFCDEQERVCRHPMAPVFPETMLVTVQLTAEGPEHTRVTVTSEAVGPVSPAEMQAFIDLRTSMTQGWTGSFDQLEALLPATVPA